MSSALGVRQWYRGSTAASRPVVPSNGRHARDFGVSFVDDDSNGSKSLPPLPPLIPLVSNRRKRRLSSDKGQRGSDMSVQPSDSVNVNSDSQDNSKLLRLFGGGDSDSGVSVHSVEASDRVSSCCKQPAASAIGGAVAAAAASRLTDVCSESVQGVGEGGGGPSRCTVLLDPIPSELLASLSCDGSISAEKAAKTCQQTHEWEDSLPMISDNEVQGLLNGLVDDGAAEDDDVSAELARSQRQESLLQQPPPPLPPLRDSVAPAPATADADATIDRDDVRDEESRDATPSTATTPGRKLRHRKCETLPRRSTRARRERHSTSSVGEKRRKRSTSSSTTSSACSTTSHPHKHRHKHRHRHRSPAAPVFAVSEEVAPVRPRVNPIFVWVKQEDTRIVEVLCEDYDKRNRIRLTKTPHGWRATPRTERLSSAPFFSAATTACSIEGGGGAEQENVHEDDDCEEEHDDDAALSMSDGAHDHPDDAALKGLEDDNQIPPVNDINEAVSLQTKADDLDEVVNEVPLDEEAAEDEEEEEAGEHDEEESSYNGVDKTLGMPLSPQTHVQSPPQVSSHRLSEHEDDSAPPAEQMEQDDSEYHERNAGDNEDIADDSLIDSNLCISISKVDADETKEEDDAEHLVETVLKSPAREATECVAVALDATVEREIKQVVQKDGVVNDEPMETEVSEPSKETVAEAEVAELLPTDLTVPKSANEPRAPPRVASVRSMASILRTPKVPMTMLASLHRASPRPGISPDLPEPAITPGVQPAHQAQPQHRSQFLESLLSTPKMCHQVSKPIIDSGAVPLDLGKSSVRSSTVVPPQPQVTCSSDVIKAAVKKDVEEISVKCKVEDITLKNLLTKRLEAKKVLKEENLEAQRKELESRMAEESKKDRKSRLLELLTSSESINHKLASSDLDPLTQLKKILSDPEMAIPDPLLVPRDRLQDLVSCPAKEIPRLLTLRPELRLPEALAYPSLLQDPNLLVVSISYLQSLLRSPEKPSKDDSHSTLGAFLDWQRFQSQQQNDFLQAQMKQQSIRNGARDMDAATAQAFNQMMWLPYLNQLEASAMACGNNQEFLSMLNAVFPSGSYPNAYSAPSPFPPGMGMMPGFPAPADFKSQLEMQQTLAMWQEAMMQTAMPPPASHSRNPLGVEGPRDPPRRSLHSPKKRASSARTNPIGPKVNPGSRAGSGGNHASMQLPSHMAGQGWQGHPYHSQPSQQQARPRPAGHPQPQQQHFSGPKQPKPEAPTSMSIHPNPVESTRPTVKCKPLRNLLSSPRREDEDMKRMATMSHSHSHLLSAFGKSSGEHPNVMDLAGARKASLEEKVAKLKVKQHLVDPALKPKLLKKEIKPEVAVGGDDKVSPTQLHPNLWHPLFGSQKASYNSPWQWTTVTVNGE